MDKTNSTETMNLSNILYPLAFILLLSLPILVADSHNHTKAIQYSPNPFEQDTVEICGDSMFVKWDRHIELNDWRRSWIIVEKPE